jgi:hypothetical protein
MLTVVCRWYAKCEVPSEEDVGKVRTGQDARRTVKGGQGEVEVG